MFLQPLFWTILFNIAFLNICRFQHIHVRYQRCLVWDPCIPNYVRHYLNSGQSKLLGVSSKAWIHPSNAFTWKNGYAQDNNASERHKPKTLYMLWLIVLKTASFYSRITMFSSFIGRSTQSLCRHLKQIIYPVM